MERINIHLIAPPADLDTAIPAFHSWIQKSLTEELLIDVVDYRHVPGGPGVVLIGHEADYSLNQSGLTYSRKARGAGSAAEKIAAAYSRAAEAGKRLGLTWSEFEVIVNDRLGTPNTEENWQALKQAITAALGENQEIKRQGEHRSRLTARVRLCGASFRSRSWPQPPARVTLNPGTP